MNDIQTITAIEQETAQVKLSSGEYTIHPLTIRRMAKLAAMLKDVQGDPAKFKNPEDPNFHVAVADMLVAAGDKMPKALGLLTGDSGLEKLEDISLLDLSAIAQAAAQVNKPAILMAGFRQAMEAFNGKPDQK